MHKFALIVFSLMVSLPLFCADKKKGDSSVLSTVVRKERDEEFKFNAHHRTLSKGKIMASMLDGQKKGTQASAKTAHAILQRSLSLPAGAGITVGQKQECTGLGRNCPCTSCVEHYGPARQDYVHPIDKLLSEVESDKDKSST